MLDRHFARLAAGSGPFHHGDIDQRHHHLVCRGLAEIEQAPEHACQKTENQQNGVKKVRAEIQHEDDAWREHVGALLKNTFLYGLAKNPDKWRRQNDGQLCPLRALGRLMSQLHAVRADHSDLRTGEKALASGRKP
jgi:hypothetical protein